MFSLLHLVELHVQLALFDLLGNTVCCVGKTADKIVRIFKIKPKHELIFFFSLLDFFFSK